MLVSPPSSCLYSSAAANGHGTHPAILRAPVLSPVQRPRGRAPLSAILSLDHLPATLAATLDSLRWCDDVVVLGRGALPPIPGAPGWENVRWINVPDPTTAAEEALRLARHDWVLHLEADEVISASLAAELTSLRPELSSCYRLRVKTAFQGRAVGFGPTARQGEVRFFNRRVAAWQSGLDGALALAVGHLQQRPLSHPILRQGGEKLGQLLISSHLRAAHWARSQRGTRPVSIPSALIRTAAQFGACYLLQGGILQGRAGLLLSLAEAQTTFWSHVLHREAVHSDPLRAALASR